MGSVQARSCRSRETHYKTQTEIIMKFKSKNSANSIVTEGDTAPSTNGSHNLKALLEAGKRLAGILPLYIDSRSLHPTARFASVGVVRAQVRFCIAALGDAGEGGLAALRERLSRAVRAIQSAPNEVTARAIYDSPQVQESLWSWAAAEASLFIRNMTKNAPPDADKQADLIGDVVIGFMREESKRQGKQKLNPFSMARTWMPEQMADPIGTYRAYLMAWCRKYVSQYYQQQVHEGVSLDAPVGGTGDEEGRSRGEMVEDRNNPNPEAAVVDRDDHRSQVSALTATYERQVAGLEADIRAFDGKTDAFSLNQRIILQNRLDAIQEMVAPLLVRLRETSEALSVTEKDQRLDPQQRKRQLALLQQNFDSNLHDLTAISDAQEQAHGKRLTREQENAAPESQTENPVYKGKKLFSDPLTTARAYARAGENAERLLPHVYRVLTHRKNTDLSQKYTSGLLTNWKLLDGINSQADLEAALSPDPAVRATANDRALFATTALRVMILLRDSYTFAEKYDAVRGDDEKVPKSAKQRFLLLMQQETENDPILRASAPQLLELLKEFVTGNGFRTLWENTDYTSRSAAYEWARNNLNKRWSDLTGEEINTVADEAGNLLYDNQHHPFAAWSQGDPQRRVTRDLDLTPEERREIMRQEVGRIRDMVSGSMPRGTWAHGEPVGSPRFHDKPRASPSAPSPLTEVSDPTITTATMVIRARRFACKSV